MTGAGWDRHERWCARAMAAVLGEVILDEDHPGAAAGTPDASFLDRRAWAEFTVLTSSLQMESDALLRERRVVPIAGPRSWWVSLDRDVDDIKRFDRTLPRVLALMEEVRVATDDELLAAVQLDDDSDWLVSMCQLSAMDRDSSGPAAFVMPPGAFAAYGGDVVSEPLAAALAERPLARKLDKLLTRDAEERHLFVLARESGIGPSAWFAISDSEVDDIPLVDPPLPAGITHVWLAAGHGSRLMLWSRGLGWGIREFDISTVRVHELPSGTLIASRDAAGV